MPISIQYGLPESSGEPSWLFFHTRTRCLLSLLDTAALIVTWPLETRKLSRPSRRKRKTTASGHFSSIRLITDWLIPNGLLTVKTVLSFSTSTATLSVLRWVVILKSGEESSPRVTPQVMPRKAEATRSGMGFIEGGNERHPLTFQSFYCRIKTCEPEPRMSMISSKSRADTIKLVVGRESLTAAGSSTDSIAMPSAKPINFCP